MSTPSTVGLSTDEAARRLRDEGPNELPEARVSVLRRLASYFVGPIPFLIEIAAVVSAFLGRWPDLCLLAAMLLVNAVVGFWQEHRAESAIDALKARLALTARVLRDGSWRELPARELVRGDVIALKLGQIVPADVRLADGAGLSIDQSALTGESLPVDKGAGDEAWSGSIVRQGQMRAEVTVTGPRTYFGRTAHLLEGARATSHFQRAVLRIGDFLLLLTAGLGATVLVAALFRAESLAQTFVFVLVLAVAAIPAALPAVLSVTMAVGAEKLAALRAVVSRLAAVEELAGVSTLCSDKTGTLTENQITVGAPVLLSAGTADEVLEAAALTCAPDSPDAIDAAVLRAAPLQALANARVVAFHPFDPAGKRAEAEVERDGLRFRATKGAAQVVFELAAMPRDERLRAEAQVDALARDGYRALAVASTGAGGAWRVLGLLPLFDPLRKDSAETVRRLASVGVDVKMITGDHAAIARRIAKQLGLSGNVLGADTVRGAAATKEGRARVALAEAFAQVLPEDKYEIVQALQAQDVIVGMTGDGVNDAPALRQADAGIAVSGATDAARAAADLVLTAPGLTVIADAIVEARRVFSRMNAYATFRIAETVRVLLFMTLSILVFRFYPVTPVMVVLLALLNDMPIMTIAYDHAPVAPHPVRWQMGRVLTISTVLGCAGVVASFLLFWFAEVRLRLPAEQIRTLLFLKLLVAGHLTLYLTRARGHFFRRPWPSLILLGATEGTQLLGTLAAVYGVLLEPLGWGLALGVWGYALAWFAVNDLIKVATEHFLDRRDARAARHLARVEARLAHSAR